MRFRQIGNFLVYEICVKGGHFALLPPRDRKKRSLFLYRRELCSMERVGPMLIAADIASKEASVRPRYAIGRDEWSRIFLYAKVVH